MFYFYILKYIFFTFVCSSHVTSMKKSYSTREEEKNYKANKLYYVNLMKLVFFSKILTTYYIINISRYIKYSKTIIKLEYS